MPEGAGRHSALSFNSLFAFHRSVLCLMQRWRPRRSCYWRRHAAGRMAAAPLPTLVPLPTPARMRRAPALQGLLHGLRCMPRRVPAAPRLHALPPSPSWAAAAPAPARASKHLLWSLCLAAAPLGEQRRCREPPRLAAPAPAWDQQSVPAQRRPPDSRRRQTSRQQLPHG